ncbi:MAG: FtsQ-type POTRA domain-containing protein [Proteobacteria bacterium]|nr:FtsQ-type POTRA domain-containing protein [Pseudomonadota bacterium]
MRSTQSRVRRLQLPATRRLIGGAVALVVLGTAAAGAQWCNANWDSVKAEGEEFIARQIGAKVDRIMVTGMVNTNPQAMREALGMKKGDSLVGFSVADARSRIEDLDWVARASVVRELPSTLKVEIEEYKPLARLELNDSTWVIDRDGTLITSHVDGFDKLPLLQGKGAAAQAAGLFALIGEMPELSSRFVGATYVGERRWDLQFSSGVSVMLPEENPGRALRMLKILDSRRGVLAMENGAVDFRLPDRIVLRMGDAANGLL